MRLFWNFLTFFVATFNFNLIFAAGTSFVDSNEHKSKVLQRQKRFLIFNNGGVAKFITGYLGPIDTEAYINCNAIRNFQFQFDTPPNITTAFSRVPARPDGWDPPEGRGFGGGGLKPDSTRKMAYEIIEEVLVKEGKNGHECMLRAICEVAETPVNHNGLVGELLQLFFTPGKHERLHADYHHARHAGLQHVNCEKLFPECPLGHGMLDSFSLIKEFKFNSWLNF